MKHSRKFTDTIEPTVGELTIIIGNFLFESSTLFIQFHLSSSNIGVTYVLCYLALTMNRALNTINYELITGVLRWCDLNG